MAQLAALAQYVLRPMADNEVPFVWDSWLNDWRTSRYAGVIPNHLYYSTQRTLIEDLMGRGAKVIVAAQGSEVLGWTCGEVKDVRTVHHYTYVKDPFVGKGIEERLLAALPGTKPGFFTHAQERFLKDRKWNWTPEICRRLSL